MAVGCLIHMSQLLTVEAKIDVNLHCHVETYYLP